MTRRLQNKIAESSATLPVACVVATLLWWLPLGAVATGGRLELWTPETWSLLLGWIVCALTTYVVLETVAQNALLRIRSRMISTLYLLMMAACSFLHPLSNGLLCQLCLACCFYQLLATYEQSQPESHTLRAYLFLSVGSLLWAPLLVLVPVLLWCQAVFLRSLSWRSLNAAVIGLLLPYLFWGTALTVAMMASFLSDPLTDTSEIGRAVFQPLIDHGQALLGPFTAPFTWQWDIRERLTETITFGITLLFSATGTIHYIRKNYDDKIRVRMCHYTLITVQLIVLAWMVAQPALFHHLYPLLLLTTAPAAAHFIALTHTWLSNAWTLLLLTLLTLHLIIDYSLIL